MLEHRSPDHDEVLRPFIERLRALPPSEPRARAAILARVRHRPASPLRAFVLSIWRPSMPVLAATAVDVAALGVGYAARVVVEPTSSLVADGSPLAASTGAVPVSDGAQLSTRVARQFLLSFPGAQRVALVGDFNDWDPAAATMVDPTGTGVWETTVLLAPGRHTYAFLVDSLLIPDPRMPQVSDTDFGRSRSVVFVSDQR